MKIFNSFLSVFTIVCADPFGLFARTLKSNPFDQIPKVDFSTLVDLGVEDFSDLPFGFTINDDWWRGRLSSSRELVFGIRFELGYVKDWMNGAKILREVNSV